MEFGIGADISETLQETRVDPRVSRVDPRVSHRTLQKTRVDPRVSHQTLISWTSSGLRGRPANIETKGKVIELKLDMA